MVGEGQGGGVAGLGWGQGVVWAGARGEESRPSGSVWQLSAARRCLKSKLSVHPPDPTAALLQTTTQSWLGARRHAPPPPLAPPPQGACGHMQRHLGGLQGGRLQGGRLGSPSLGSAGCHLGLEPWAWNSLLYMDRPVEHTHTVTLQIFMHIHVPGLSLQSVPVSLL